MYTDPDMAPSDPIRNLGVLAHVDAGKTSLTERMLHVAGLRRDAGDVDEGTTATDYLAVERLHGITIKAAAVRFSWNGYRFHLIDTPGHVDFGTEVERALRVLDGAVIALCGVSGVQARTEVIVRACARRSLPRICFVNKMDRRGADFGAVVAELRASLEPGAVPVCWPIFEAGRFAGVIDLIRPQAHALEPAARAARQTLVEALADIDPSIMEDFVQGAETSPERLMRALREGTRTAALAPVLCGTAFSDLSGALLLQAIADFLPSPPEAGVPEGLDPRDQTRHRAKPGPEAPFSAFVFKTSLPGGADTSDSGNLLSWTRVWSGPLREGDRILDARSGSFARVSRIHGIVADRLESAVSASAGEIVALNLAPATGRLPAGMSVAPSAPGPGAAGASLCDPAHPLRYEELLVPQPVVSLVLEPDGPGELPRLGEALSSLGASDAALRIIRDADTGRFEISGLGELHLEVTVERLRREYGVRVRAGQPRVSCRERPLRAAAAREDFDRDVGGERVRTMVAVRLAPVSDADDTAPSGTSASGTPVFSVRQGIRPAPVHLEALRRGALGVLSAGPAEGWPVEGALAEITDFTPPSASGRSGETAVEAAAAFAARAALLQAGSAVMEPVMILDIETPESAFGAVLAELNARGARIESVQDTPGGKLISARAPLARLFGMAGALRSASSGHADFQARFGSYERRRA